MSEFCNMVQGETHETLSTLHTAAHNTLCIGCSSDSYQLVKQITALSNKHQSPALLWCTPWFTRYDKQKPHGRPPHQRHTLYVSLSSSDTVFCTTCLSSYDSLPLNACLTQPRIPTNILQQQHETNTLV